MTQGLKTNLLPIRDGLTVVIVTTYASFKIHSPNPAETGNPYDIKCDFSKQKKSNQRKLLAVIANDFEPKIERMAE
jgi:hypothetical protein